MVSELNVLIVEDELIYLRHLESKLKGRVKKIFTANNSEQGKAVLSLERLDLIFLDNLLPGADGLEVLRAYRKSCPNAKIVLMSSIFTIDEIHSALKNGAHFVFNKKKDTVSQLDYVLQATAPASSVVPKKNLFDRIIGFLKPSKKNKAQSNARKQIAIVEDDEIFSRQLEKVMKETYPNDTYQVYLFSDEKSFREAVLKKRQAFDLVFLDYYLPDATGNEVMEFIQSEIRKVIIIVMSTQLDPNLVIDVIQKGAKDYIVKNGDWKTNFIKSLENTGLF